MSTELWLAFVAASAVLLIIPGANHPDGNRPCNHPRQARHRPEQVRKREGRCASVFIAVARIDDQIGCRYTYDDSDPVSNMRTSTSIAAAAGIMSIMMMRHVYMRGRLLQSRVT